MVLYRITHETAAAIHMRGIRNSKVMPLVTPLPMSHTAHAFPMAAVDTTAVSPPKRTLKPVPLNQRLGGLDGSAPTIISTPRRDAESTNVLKQPAGILGCLDTGQPFLGTRSRRQQMRLQARETKAS
jgi:hypothetical protein